eukprot:1349392-Amorphochlora_amoeboformis.AAC.1
MQKIFADLEYSVCLYAIGLSTFSNGKLVIHTCMHRYIETRKRWPNLANAFKYTLCQVSAPWSPYRLFWLALIVFTTLYTYFWDIIMDWGLFQFQPVPTSPTIALFPFAHMFLSAIHYPIELSCDYLTPPCTISPRSMYLYTQGARHPLLRPNRLFPKTLFYYWAICSNLVLRFTWVVTLIPFPFQVSKNQTGLIVVLGLILLLISTPVRTADLYRESEHTPSHVNPCGAVSSIPVGNTERSGHIRMYIAMHAHSIQ